MPPKKKSKLDTTAADSVEGMVQLVECEVCLKWRIVSQQVYDDLQSKALTAWMCENAPDLTSCEDELKDGEFPPTIKQPSVKTIEDWFQNASAHLYSFAKSKNFLGDYSHARWYACIEDGTLFILARDAKIDVGRIGYARHQRHDLLHSVRAQRVEVALTKDVGEIIKFEHQLAALTTSVSDALM